MRSFLAILADILDVYILLWNVKAYSLLRSLGGGLRGVFYSDVLSYDVQVWVV